jgi:kynurenine--oxoglutarate transaminase/cysteine-S-conjugate beta-lyase/glutamine--phenylpyruvate transaminase
MFTSRTKSIILNTPHNPVGKVFSQSELEHIAALCAKWNVLCISDEVYEWMVYKPNKHIRIGKQKISVSKVSNSQLFLTRLFLYT